MIVKNTILYNCKKYNYKRIIILYKKMQKL